MNKNTDEILENHKLRLEELIDECTRGLGEVNKLLDEKVTIQKQAEKIDNKKPNKIKVGENILFKLRSSTILIAVERIKCIAANNQYTSVVLDDNRTVIIRRSITEWEFLLPENVFLRIHRSTIINTKFIDHIENIDNKHIVILKNTAKNLKISQRYFRKLNYKHNINSGNFKHKKVASSR